MPPQKCLEVSAAGKCGLYLYQQFSLGRNRSRNSADLDTARFFQDSGTHRSDFQFAAKKLAQNSSDNKKRDIPVINSEMDPGEDNGRDRQMNIKKPFQGIFSGLSPEISEKKIQDKGQEKNDGDRYRTRRNVHWETYLKPDWQVKQPQPLLKQGKRKRIA